MAEEKEHGSVSCQQGYKCTLPPILKSQKSNGSTSSQIKASLERTCPSILAFIVCAIFVTVHPISHLSDKYAYFVLIAYTLYFHPGNHTVGKQVQVTVIGILGGLAGLGVSALAIELGCVANTLAGSDDSIGGRASPAVFLAFITFIGANIKSRYPRLASGALISVYVSIWLLASSVHDFRITAKPFLGLLYSILFPSSISLFFTILIFPRTANRVLAEKLSSAMGTSSALLLASLHLFQADILSDLEDTRATRDHLLQLRTQLSGQIGNLWPLYAEARYEISFSRVSVTEYEGLIDSLINIQAVLGSKMGLDTALPTYFPRDVHIAAQSRHAVDNLGTTCLQALEVVHNQLLDTLQSRRHSRSREKDITIETMQSRLEDAAEAFAEAVVAHLNKEYTLDTASEYSITTKSLGEQMAFQDAFFFTSMIDLVRHILQALSVASQLELSSRDRRHCLWFPLFSGGFLHGGRDANIERDEEADVESIDTDDEDDDSADFDARSTRTLSIYSGTEKGLLLRRLLYPEYYLSLWRALRRRVLRSWNISGMRKKRLWLHKRLRAIARSRHVRYGLKCSLGVSLITLPGHLPYHSEGFGWFKHARGDWIAVSFLYCFQTTTAGTYRIALFRTLGTLLGALYAFACFQFVGTNPYGLVGVLAFQSLLTDPLITLTKRYSYMGQVIQMTMPPILFIPYLGLEYSNIGELALTRAYDMEIGIVAALILNLLIWPYHARVQLVTTCAKVTDRLVNLYLSMSKAQMNHDARNTVGMQNQFGKLEGTIRALLHRSSSLCNQVHLELSLLPRPVKTYRSLTFKLEEMLQLLSDLRSIQQQIPRQLAAYSAKPQRADLTSAILLNMHAVSHSLHTRSAVPLFLPQPRIMLDLFTSAFEQQVNLPFNDQTDAELSSMSLLSLHAWTAFQSVESVLPGTSRKSAISGPSLHQSNQISADVKRFEFSFAFLLAEKEAFSEIVETLDDILEICKTLFGTASFIHADEAGLLSLTAAGYNTPAVKSARLSMSMSGAQLARTRTPVIVKGGSVG